MSDYEKKGRGQSHSRAMRRKFLKERYGPEWKAHEFTLAKLMPIGW